MSDTRKVVINGCFGGFSLSRLAFLRLREIGHPLALAEPDYGEKYSDGSGPRERWGSGVGAFLRDIPRDDPSLVAVVEEMGELANGDSAGLQIVEIPADVRWEISEYDGNEHVAESHRTWS